MAEQTTLGFPGQDACPAVPRSRMARLAYHIYPLDISKSFSLADLLHVEDLHNIQQVFSELTGQPCFITDTDGCLLTASTTPPQASQLHRHCSAGVAECRNWACSLGEEARQLLYPAVAPCPVCGLSVASAPIIVAGRHIANWLVDATEHTRQSPDQESLQPVLHLLRLLTQEISSLGYNNLLLGAENQKLQQARREIRRLNISLRRRIQQFQRTNIALENTVSTLQQTQETLLRKEKMAALGHLVAGIAHEISTPVGVSVTAASLLSQETASLCENFSAGTMKRSDLEAYLLTVQEVAQILGFNLQHAAELISSFKKVAVVQSNETYCTFNLPNHLRDVLLSLRPELKQHQVSLHCAEDLMLRSYPGVFAQIFNNLLLNAVIHAFPHTDSGCIDIRVYENPLVPDQLRITFSDNGAGIAPEHLDRIFDPFFTTRRGSGGTGLGLHILYNLVTQTLGGTISCRSVPGTGTHFTLIIPRETEEFPNGSQ